MVAVDAIVEDSLLDLRALQLSNDLQIALNTNSLISTTGPVYEYGRKLLYELRIKHLLGIPLSQLLYQEALTIANIGETQAGRAAFEMMDFLGYCDWFEIDPGQNEYVERSNATNDALVATRLKIEPNPSTGTIQISSMDRKVVRIDIFDLHGIKVFSSMPQPSANSLTLQLGELPSGVYFVFAHDENGTLPGIGKLILAK